MKSDYADLEAEDLRQALRYAAATVDGDDSPSAP